MNLLPTLIDEYKRLMNLLPNTHRRVLMYQELDAALAVLLCDSFKAFTYCSAIVFKPGVFLAAVFT
jgi:hypothetical protein